METRFITKLARVLNKKALLSLSYGAMASVLAAIVLVSLSVRPLFVSSKPKLRIELSPREFYQAGDAQLHLKRFRVYNEGKEVVKDVKIWVNTSADIENLELTSGYIVGAGVCHVRKGPGGTEYRVPIASLFPGSYVEFVLIVTGPVGMHGSMVVKVLGEYGAGRFVGDSVAEQL